MADLPSSYRDRIEKLAFETLPQAGSIYAINGAEKLKGYREFYKIRFGDYRVGFRYENGILTLERVLHRKDIYRYFPI